ncbi:hypothetical protein [Rhodococcus spongiicola]|uniref:Uncharacterized protein n=1 Tax=Rhodococcus spongiicola TaxID=2487352 RepID=A0A438APF2_9NOCA|nr:hypothetical protein [Rhodococcus spongiicola]RVW00351.1 hypothetical protein EF834_16940 [Rhodococcus spongiicola]
MTVQVAPTERVPRSTAANRAYKRRHQRSSTIDGHAAAVISQGTSPRTIVARIPFVAMILGLLGLGLAATLLLTTRAAEDSYELADARAHNESLRQQAATLQRDVIAGNSAPVLAVKAAEQGLIPAKDPARLVLDADGTVHVIGTPTPAQGEPVAPLDRTPSPAPEAPAPEAPAPEALAQQVQTAPPSETVQPSPRPNNDGRIQARGERLTPVAVVTPPSAGAQQ